MGSTRRLKPRLTKIAFGDKSTFVDSWWYRFAMNKLFTKVSERELSALAVGRHAAVRLP
jgi:hypothetical protein